MVEGVLRVGQTIASSKTGREYRVGEVGLLTPSHHPCPALYPGQVLLLPLLLLLLRLFLHLPLLVLHLPLLPLHPLFPQVGGT